MLMVHKGPSLQFKVKDHEKKCVKVTRRIKNLEKFKDQ